MPDVKTMTARSGDAGDILLYNHQGQTTPEASKQVLASDAGEAEINIDYYVHDSTTYPGLSPLPTAPIQLGSNGPALGLHDYESTIDRSLQNFGENTALLNFRKQHCRPILMPQQI